MHYIRAFTIVQYIKFCILSIIIPLTHILKKENIFVTIILLSLHEHSKDNRHCLKHRHESRFTGLIKKRCHWWTKRDFVAARMSVNYQKQFAHLTSILLSPIGNDGLRTRSINDPCGRLHAINPQYRIDINWPRGSTIKTLRRRTASLRVIIAGLMPHRPRTP